MRYFNTFFFFLYFFVQVARPTIGICAQMDSDTVVFAFEVVPQKKIIHVMKKGSQLLIFLIKENASEVNRMADMNSQILVIY